MPPISRDFSLMSHLPWVRPPSAECPASFPVFPFSCPYHRSSATKARGQRHRRADRWFCCIPHLPSASAARLCGFSCRHGLDVACRFPRRSPSPLLRPCCRGGTGSWGDWRCLGHGSWWLMKQDPVVLEQVAGPGCRTREGLWSICRLASAPKLPCLLHLRRPEQHVGRLRSPF